MSSSTDISNKTPLQAPSYEEALTRPIVKDPGIVIQYREEEQHVRMDRIVSESPSLVRGRHQVIFCALQRRESLV